MFRHTGHFRGDKEGKAEYMAELEPLLYSSEDGELARHLSPCYYVSFLLDIYILSTAQGHLGMKLLRHSADLL